MNLGEIKQICISFKILIFSAGYEWQDVISSFLPTLVKLIRYTQRMQATFNIKPKEVRCTG